MVKRKMILADADGLYLNNLSNYFMEKAPQLELHVFTSQDMLHNHLKNGGKTDILVVDAAFATAELEALGSGIVRIALSSDMMPIKGYELVRKYQKSEKLLGEILLKHAEYTGSVDSIQGKSHTKLAAFFSPAGGTGKTVLSLALAVACAKKGMKTLYLNFEEIDSVQDIFAPAPGSMSDVFLALKTKGVNAGIKLASCVGMEPVGGFYYLSGLESVTEYKEIGEEELHHLLDSVKKLAEYDVVILDTTSDLGDKTEQILEDADIVFVPIVSNESAVSKMLRYLDETEIHEFYQDVLRKMNLIVNQSGVAGVGKEIQESGLMSRIPCCTAIAASPVFTKKENVLRSGDMLWSVMESLVKEISV